jgi:hypothetical protein
MATPFLRQPAFRRGEKVRRPCFECGAFPLCPIMPLQQTALSTNPNAVCCRRLAAALRAALGGRPCCPTGALRGAVILAALVLMILLVPRHSTRSAPPPAPVSLPPGELTGGRGAPLTNAQKQERWRRRNQIVLGDDADDIAAKLIGLDRRKLRRIVTLIVRHLKATRGLRKDDARNHAHWRGAFARRLPAGIKDDKSAVWEWRRAHGQAAVARERQAWLDDHPGKALPSTRAR